VVWNALQPATDDHRETPTFDHSDGLASASRTKVVRFVVFLKALPRSHKALTKREADLRAETRSRRGAKKVEPTHFTKPPFFEGLLVKGKSSLPRTYASILKVEYPRLCRVISRFTRR